MKNSTYNKYLPNNYSYIFLITTDITILIYLNYFFIKFTTDFLWKIDIFPKSILFVLKYLKVVDLNYYLMIGDFIEAMYFPFK